jgi:hypothetical protein
MTGMNLEEDAGVENGNADNLKLQFSGLSRYCDSGWRDHAQPGPYGQVR